MSKVQSDFTPSFTSRCVEMTPSEARVLLARHHVSEQVCEHGEIVGLVARALGVALLEAGVRCDVETVHAAGIVHDICKGTPHHDAEAVRLFLSMGMPRMAALTGHHQDMNVPLGSAFSEAEVVFLADKLVQGIDIVPVSTRYDAKMRQFKDNPEALAAVQLRKNNALNTLNRFAQITKRDAEQIARSVAKCIGSTERKHVQDDLNYAGGIENGISVVILAAGFSSRMGSFKPLLSFGNGTVLSHLVSIWKRCEIKNILAVSGYMSASLEIEAARIGICTVRNQNPENGMFSSVQIGLRELLKYTKSSWIAVHPVDIPLIEPKTIQKLAEKTQYTDADVLYPVCNGRQGHPPLIRRSVAEYVVQMDIGSNLRDVLAHFSSCCVDIDDTGVITDMDFPYEYDYALQRLKSMQV